MVRRRCNFGLLKSGITKTILSSPTNKLVGHAVYNDWNLAIRLFLRIESFVVANLRVPSEFLIQLLEIATRVGSQQIVKMLLPLDEDLLGRL